MRVSVDVFPPASPARMRRRSVLRDAARSSRSGVVIRKDTRVSQVSGPRSLRDTSSARIELEPTTAAPSAPKARQTGKTRKDDSKPTGEGEKGGGAAVPPNAVFLTGQGAEQGGHRLVR